MVIGEGKPLMALCIAELQVQLEEPMPGEFGKGKVSPEEWVERE
jgi:hypothetical protein